MLPLELLSKTLSLYQNCVFTPLSDRLKTFAYAVYSHVKDDESCRLYWAKLDIEHLDHTYFPQLHIGAPLNDTANKLLDANKMSFKLHGNYCGPGWSDGKYQPSVRDGSSKPIDELDDACREHDSSYATPDSDLANADDRLASRAWHSGNLHVALPIKIQSMLRKIGIMDRYSSKDLLTKLNNQSDMALS